MSNRTPAFTPRRVSPRCTDEAAQSSVEHHDSRTRLYTVLSSYWSRKAGNYMKVVTLVRQVPDAEAHIRSSDGVLDLSGVTFVIDSMDEYGVEEAVRLKESGHDVEVVALALGPDTSKDALRTALAIGADQAMHIVTDTDLDTITEARALAQMVTEAGAELVFVGGKHADRDSSALGPALAAILGWPHIDWVTSLELEGAALRLNHDTDEGSAALTVSLPAVVTTQQGLNEPRYPTLPNVMKAKRKPLSERPLADLAIGEPATVVEAQEVQAAKRRGQILEGEGLEAAQELVRLLREEVRVIA